MDKLEYRKLILSRVSFSPDVFEKELKKSVHTLDDKEVCLLKIWCIRKFGKEYPEILVDSFKIIPHR
jgi:hypothetical protein